MQEQNHLVFIWKYTAVECRRMTTMEMSLTCLLIA